MESITKKEELICEGKDFYVKDELTGEYTKIESPIVTLDVTQIQDEEDLLDYSFMEMADKEGRNVSAV